MRLRSETHSTSSKRVPGHLVRTLLLELISVIWRGNQARNSRFPTFKVKRRGANAPLRDCSPATDRYSNHPKVQFFDFSMRFFDCLLFSLLIWAEKPKWSKARLGPHPRRTSAEVVQLPDVPLSLPVYALSRPSEHWNWTIEESSNFEQL